MRSGLICRSTERRRTGQINDTPNIGCRRSSTSVVSETQLNSLLVPGQDKRRNSLNTLSVPSPGVRRRSSYSGPSTEHLSDLLVLSRRKSSTQDKFGFNPVVEKLGSGQVRNILFGLAILFVLVLLTSLYKLLT